MGRANSKLPRSHPSRLCETPRRLTTKHLNEQTDSKLNPHPDTTTTTMTPSQPKVDKNSPHSDETTRQVVKIDPDTLQCLVNEATLTIE